MLSILQLDANFQDKIDILTIFHEFKLNNWWKENLIYYKILLFILSYNEIYILFDIESDFYIRPILERICQQTCDKSIQTTNLDAHATFVVGESWWISISYWHWMRSHYVR